MKMMLGFQHLRERISHFTHDAWHSIVTTTDHVRTTTLNIRRRTSDERKPTSQDQHNRPHSRRDTRWLTPASSGARPR